MLNAHFAKPRRLSPDKSAGQAQQTAFGALWWTFQHTNQPAGGGGGKKIVGPSQDSGGQRQHHKGRGGCEWGSATTKSEAVQCRIWLAGWWGRGKPCAEVPTPEPALHHRLCRGDHPETHHTVKPTKFVTPTDNCLKQISWHMEGGLQPGGGTSFARPSSTSNKTQCFNFIHWRRLFLKQLC